MRYWPAHQRHRPSAKQSIKHAFSCLISVTKKRQIGVHFATKIRLSPQGQKADPFVSASGLATA